MCRLEINQYLCSFWFIYVYIYMCIYIYILYIIYMYIYIYINETMIANSTNQESTSVRHDQFFHFHAFLFSNEKLEKHLKPFVSHQVAALYFELTLFIHAKAIYSYKNITKTCRVKTNSFILFSSGHK